MSAEKATSPCGKFQANIFNKSKCQNCFKSRELHLLGDRDMEQAKPVYGGWLCLAPEGTDFDNPMQRSRKWQRRFFVLYEDGSLSFALDELPSTLPQGTVNMNLCTEISDAEPRTGQRNALCVVTPEQEIFIRDDNKEIINGWSEQLAVYLRTNKLNPKKKRKVEPVATQEPSPAKMAATESSFPSCEKAPESSCAQWQEELRGSGPGLTPMWTDTDTRPLDSERPPAGFPAPRDPPASDDISPVGSLDLVASRNINNQLTEPSSRSPHRRHGSPTERIMGSEDREGSAASRKGRSETRSNKREKLQSCGDITQLGAPPPQRRARSLDRRMSDTVMTPDLLNFKKGWMVKLDGTDQWKKYWFVLSADSLRFYKDSIAEEASDLEGEIDLSKCYNVSEYQVQRNYGFQIHTPNGVYTLSAMTSGIRKNWIQALMKNVHPGHAPDVASLPGHRSPPDALPKPDVTPSAEVSAETHSKHRTVSERRQEGRYRTFDWAEFRLQNKSTRDADPQRTKAPCSLELGELERRKRREERRRRYESMLGISLGDQPAGGSGGVTALSPKSQQQVEEEVEECWRLVEATVFRLDRTVPLLTEHRDPAGLEKLLEGYRKEMEDLKAQLEESECCRLELEARLRSAGYFQQQEPSSSPDSDFCPNETQLNGHTKTLTDTYEERSFTQPTPSIWLHDTEGNLQELRDSSSETEASPLLSPASDSQDVFSRSDTKEQGQQVLGSEINHGEYGSLTLEEQNVARKLSLEVELLTSQNEALNQRNQEMVNQLTEADREIERLKAELSSRHVEPRHLPEEEEEQEEQEQQQQPMLEDLQRELSLRNQELLEAQTLITSLEENLRETEALLRLNTEGTGREEVKGAEEAEEDLVPCLEAGEETLSALERQLSPSEETSEEHLTEGGNLYGQTAAETEGDAGVLDEELNEEETLEGEDDGRVPSEERIQEVIEGEVMRLNVLGKLLELICKSDIGSKKENEEGQLTAEGRLRWEEEFWNSLHHELKSSPFQEEEPVGELLSEVTERMLAEKRMLLLGLETDEGLVTKSADERSVFDVNDPLCEMKRLRDVTQVKISWLNHLATADSSSIQEKLRLMADRLSDFSKRSWSDLVHSAATEAICCCRLNRLRSKHWEELQELTSCLVCSTCVQLTEENEMLRAKVSQLELEELRQSVDQSVCCQTEEIRLQDRDIQVEEQNREDVQTPEGAEEEEETVEMPELHLMEIPPSGVDSYSSDVSFEMEEVLLLRRRVKELDERLSVIEEELKEEFAGKMSCVQAQHEKQLGKLKATCEHGFASMEDSHVRMVEELQRRHQQEVERLLVERDRLLEEESAATATAIEAIKNAHRLELEREVEKRRQTEARTGDAHLVDVYRQHSEELTSYQRELQVLSQQFSLRCLENGHLMQALDAERKALCQCQQENQDLRTRNQELSSHLAAEITRLCSLAKQDEPPLTQEMCVYEMEITLRVKESEVQCLKQEITSLKDELQSAQRDKRNATKKYKDVLTELSISRAKTDREMDELRENLRLAHRALDQTSS